MRIHSVRFLRITFLGFAVLATLGITSNPTGAAEQPIEGDSPRATIYRTTMPPKIDGRLDDPAWFAAPSVGPFQFPWWKKGKKEQTVAKLAWDDACLYAAYLCQDAYIAAKLTQREDPVWQEDCVEIFVAPNIRKPRHYFNFEMNARGALLDGHHPDASVARGDTSWDSKGVRVAGSMVGTADDDSDEDQVWIVEVAIPWSNFEPSGARLPPKAGDAWRLNLNRCSGKTNYQFSQWSPSGTKKSESHAPQGFGRVQFSDKRLPFGN